MRDADPHKHIQSAHYWRPAEALPWLMAIAAFFVFPDYMALGSQVLIIIVFALSLDLILGYAGIITLGHAAYFGAGAYAVAMAYAHGGWTEPLSGLALGAVAGAMLGLLAGVLAAWLIGDFSEVFAAPSEMLGVVLAAVAMVLGFVSLPLLKKGPSWGPRLAAALAAGIPAGIFFWMLAFQVLAVVLPFSNQGWFDFYVIVGMVGTLAWIVGATVSGQALWFTERRKRVQQPRRRQTGRR